MHIEQRKTLIYGHRGAKKYAPENTIPAFQKAIDQGADGFELDTMLSLDGVPVVIHDRSLMRTTNGTGYVDRKNVDTLQQLDAGSWFSEEYKEERIPLLEDVLAIFGKQTIINIELKNFQHPFDQLPEKVCNLVNRFSFVENIIFSSFVPSNLLRIRKIIPEAKTAILVSPDLIGKILSIRLMKNLSPAFIHPHYSYCSTRFVKNQHDLGRVVNAWTVSEEKTVKLMIKNEVDGIICDDPRYVMNIRDRG